MSSPSDMPVSLGVALSQRLVPVAVIDDPADALPLAQALAAGGLNVIEVTLRTESAMDSIRAIREGCPEMIVGAGTILREDQVKPCKDLGVAFLVSPGLNPRIVEKAQELGIAIVPGVVTPSEIERARNLGLSVLKFFPAESVGGVQLLSAICAPYASAGVSFVPTGGINVFKAVEYWKIRQVAAVGGSWFVDRKLIGARAFDQIEAMTRDALDTAARTQPA